MLLSVLRSGSSATTVTELPPPLELPPPEDDAPVGAAALGDASAPVAGVGSVPVADGAVRVGEDAGLPLHVFPLAETAAAHQAVQDGAVGKVLVDVGA